MHTLIVGDKHIGKSTLIQKVIRELGCPVAGFETKKEEGLADVEKGSPVYIYPAGKPRRQSEENLLGYSKKQQTKVFSPAFDRAAKWLADAEVPGGLLLMDEIGIMEASSEAFCAEILRRLDGGTPVLAAVKNKDHPFLAAVRHHPNCHCFSISEENREDLFPVVLEFVREQLDGGKE